MTDIAADHTLYTYLASALQEEWAGTGDAAEHIRGFTPDQLVHSARALRSALALVDGLLCPPMPGAFEAAAGCLAWREGDESPVVRPETRTRPGLVTRRSPGAPLPSGLFRPLASSDDLQRQGEALRSPIASWPRPALTPEERQERRWAISPPYILEPEEGEP